MPLIYDFRIVGIFFWIFPIKAGDAFFYFMNKAIFYAIVNKKIVWGNAGLTCI